MMRAIVGGVIELLKQHTHIDRSSVRVHVICFGPYSLEVETFAYVFARDWAHFQDIQQDLLLRIMDVVEAAGSRMALPAQTTYLSADLCGGKRRVVKKMPAGQESADRHSGNSI